jgi:hypothetical protein
VKTGILFGTASGCGGWKSAESILAERLTGHEVAVCSGPFGGSGMDRSWKTLSPVNGGRGGYVESLAAAVRALADWSAQLLVCVGGDGLASYAADAAIASGRPMALAGVAAGTINVGPIVSIGMDALPGFDPDRLVRRRVGAVEVLSGGRHLAYGFNDLVLGNCYLGTLDGEVVSLSADALLERGEKTRAVPSGIVAGPGFGIVKNGKPIPSRLGRIAQVVVSPLGEREFFARAVAGVLCEAPYRKGIAALVLFDSVIVKSGSPDRGWEDFSSCEQLLFEPGDTVEITGLDPGVRVIADGNPFAPEAGTLEFRSLPDLLEVAGLPPVQAGG